MDTTSSSSREMAVSAILEWNRCDIPRRVTVQQPDTPAVMPVFPTPKSQIHSAGPSSMCGTRIQTYCPSSTSSFARSSLFFFLFLPSPLLPLALFSLFPSFFLFPFLSLRLRGSSLGTHNSGFWPHNWVMRGLCADCARPPAHSEHKRTCHVRIHDATAQQLTIAHSCTIRVPISSKSPAHNSRFQQEYRAMHGGCGADSH